MLGVLLFPLQQRSIATNAIRRHQARRCELCRRTFPTLSRAINPSNSAVATAAISPRITQYGQLNVATADEMFAGAR
jgi:hypothetical protein